MSVPMGGGGYYQTAPQVSLDWLSKGWTYFTQKAGVWIGAMLLMFAAVLVMEALLFIPTGFFAAMQNNSASGNSGVPGLTPYAVLGPARTAMFYSFAFAFSGVVYILLGGLYRMGLRQMRGEEIGVGDILSVGDVALPLFGAGLMTSLLSTIGIYLCILPGLVLYGLFMFTPLLIVDRKLGAIDAMRQSVEMLKSQWLMAGVFIFVAYLVASLGLLACFVGGLATYPMFILAIAYGYFTFAQPTQAAPSYGAAQPGVWPPPPSAGAGPSLGAPGNVPQGEQPGAWPPPQGQWPPQGGAGAPPPSFGQPPSPPYGQNPPDGPNQSP